MLDYEQGPKWIFAKHKMQENVFGEHHYKHVNWILHYFYLYEEIWKWDINIVFFFKYSK